MIKKILTTIGSFLLASLLVLSNIPLHAYAFDALNGEAFIGAEDIDDEEPGDIEEITYIEHAVRPADISSILLAYIHQSPSCFSASCNFVEIFNASEEDLEVDNIRIEFYDSRHNIRAGATIDTGSGVFTARSSILLRQSYDEVALFDFDYKYNTNSIAKSGGAIVVTVIKDTTEAKSVACWGNKTNCQSKLKLYGTNLSAGFDLPIRDLFFNTRLFTKQNVDEDFQIKTFVYDYLPGHGGFISNNPIDDDLELPIYEDDSQNPAQLISPCSFIKINEISFAELHKFIELINESPETIDASNCAIKRGATKTYLERAIYLKAIFKPGEIKSFDIANTAMTKSNTSVALAIYDGLNKQMVKTKDENGDEITYQVQYTKVKENASYAWFDNEERSGWFQTFVPTPNAENEYQQFQNCPDGKMINPDTGNCVNIPKPVAECPAGQYRNPETGRCKKLPQEAVYVPCQDGYYRNPETGRCRKIQTETTLKECQEGWERNPETGRCRKKTDNSSAGFAVQNTGSTSESNMLIGFASGGVVVTGTLITASYRQDFMNFIRKFKRKK